MSTRNAPPQPRLPPYSVEAEQAVLGGLLLDNRLAPEVMERVQESEFYRADHRIVFSTICEMHEAREPCDFVTLTERLRNVGLIEDAGGLAYLATLANDTPSSANVVAYADIVRERATMRMLIASGADIAELGYRPDGRSTVELLGEAQRLVLAIESATPEVSRSRPLRELVGPWTEALFAKHAQKSAPGVQTGFRDLDAKILGLEPGDYAVIAARPSMGKTTLAMNIADHIAATSGPVAVYSLEMRQDQLLNRFVASRAVVPLHRIRDPQQLDEVDLDAVTSAAMQLHGLPLHIDDRPGLTMHDIRASALRKKRELGSVALVVIDYIQHVVGERNSSDSRTNEVDGISRAIKRLAGEMECPVLALAQLNRGVESREDKRPRMADLREAGGIEQDADLIAFIYRDEVYHPYSAHKGVAELIIGKQRNGELGTVELEYEGAFCRFKNWDGADRAQRAATVNPDKPPKKKSGLASYLNGSTHQ